MTPTLNGQPLTRTMTATAGVWQIRVPRPASIRAPRVSRTWYANGEADITTLAGDVVAIKDNAGGYYEVTATAPVVTPPRPDPRRMLTGTSTPPGGKKLPADRIVHEGATLFRIVDSAGQRHEQTGGYEAAEVDYAKAINPNVVIVASIGNTWHHGRLSHATEQVSRDYIRRNFAWIRRCDYASGFNEPEIYMACNTVPAIERARVVWGWMADELVKLGFPADRIAGIEWYRRSLIVEDCAKYPVCTVHTHDDAGDREAFLMGIRSRIGNRPLIATETSWPKREPTPEDQARGMKLTMDRAAKFCDGAVYYVGRSDPKELQWDYVAILNPDGTPRPAMLRQWQQITRPAVIVRDCIWSTKRTQRPYVPIVPGAQRIIGIRPEDAAQIANIRTLVTPGDPVYVDHFAKPHATLDERNAALATILPGIAAAGPVVLYDTIRRYDLTGVGGTESAQQQQNDRTMRTLGQWLYGVGLSLYCFDSTTPAYVTADVREAVRISGGKPVVGFVSPHWAGRADRGLVPIDTYRAYVRAAIDAGASEIVVWAHVGDAEPLTLAGYVQAAIDEASK